MLYIENTNVKCFEQGKYDRRGIRVDERRMDTWVKVDRMKKKGELVLLKEQERKRKKEERIKNDEKDTEDEEHEGMDENAILAHEEATKVKTVLEIGKHSSTPTPISIHTF